MAVNPSTIPTLSAFQQEHVGTSQSGMSGILPFQHKNKPVTLAPQTAWYSSPDAPVVSTAGYVIGSHFHIIPGGVSQSKPHNRSNY